MADIHDTSGILDDFEYWDALAARVSQNVMDGGQRSGGQRAASFVAFAASGSGWVAATLLMGFAVAVVLILQTISPTAIDEWKEAVQPSDQVGRAITLSASPPSVGALLLAEKMGDPR